MFDVEVAAHHDELDRACAVLCDPSTPVQDLARLLDDVRVAFAAHDAGEARVLEGLLAREAAASVARTYAIQARLDHDECRDASAALARLDPGSTSWYVHALELRELVRDHAGRALRLIPKLLESLDEAEGRALGDAYANERRAALAEL
jgi:hypothetical protein